MPLPTMTEAMIRLNSSEISFARGQEYFQEHRVTSLILRGSLLIGEVLGSEVEPYLVRCQFGASGITSATCTCPYTLGGWCKHIVATCLTYVHSPELLEERPTLDSLLATLNRDQLQTILMQLVDSEYHLLDRIETQVELLKPQGEAAVLANDISAKQHAVDSKAIRRQVKSALHSLERMRASEAYWQVGAVVNEVRQVLDQAWERINAGDGQDAIPILEAITEAYTAEWETLDDSDGDASDFFEDLGTAWTEALLTAPLSPQERTSWAAKLESWQEEVDAYGVDDAFGAAIDAAKQGWDYAPLKRVFQGNITHEGAWAGESPIWADVLTIARLHVLQRQERFQDYLSLAEAAGQTELYVTMLVHLGRIEEATTYGMSHLALPSEALALAQALWARGEYERGLQIAEHGLTFQSDQMSSKAPLAKWLREAASEKGDTIRALAAAIAAYEAELSLPNYHRVAELAGDHWPEIRARLLEYTRQTPAYYQQGKVDVFLSEGLIDDAIAQAMPYASHTLLEQIADAAILTHPDWVIQTGKKEAEEIMNGGKSSYYRSAANWLKRVRDAYHAQDKAAEWQAYLEATIATHKRKYTLVPLLESLRR